MKDVVATGLREDLREIAVANDVTTASTVPEGLVGQATLYAKQDGIVCGLEALAATFGLLDDRVVVKLLRQDGDDVRPEDALATIAGPVRAILVGERTALNVIGHLSGIATNVRSFVRAAPGTLLVDTRKTLPGLREIEKYAVVCGGGANHRFALWDGVLIKDTHIVAAGGVGEAVRRAKAATDLPVQAECQSLEDVDDALDAGAHALLLDNRTPQELRSLCAHIRERNPAVMVEASGGVDLDTVADIAATGVDRISVGAFTHSSKALDVSLELEQVEGEN